MSVIVLLIIISILFASGFLIAYLWAIKSGQYDDKYTPAVRILFEDEIIIKPDKNENPEVEKINEN